MIKAVRTLFKDVGFKRYFFNTSWFFSESILRIVLALLVGVWVARYLGPSNLGILSYAQSYVALFLAFSTLGLNSILERELVKTPDKANILLGTAFVLQTIGSFILTLLLLVSIFITGEDNESITMILIFGSVTFLESFLVIRIYFQSVVKGKYPALAGIISLIIGSILKITLILFKAPLIAFAIVMAMETAIGICMTVFFYYKDKQTLIRWKFDRIKAKELLSDSWPLILSAIVVSIYMKVDQVMLKQMVDGREVGIYAAAVRLSEAWYFIPGIITQSLFPAIVNAKKINDKLYYSRLQKLYDLMVVLAVAVALPTTFLSDFIISVLFGSEFSESASVLDVHIWAGVFVFLGVARGGWIINENLQRYTAVYLGIGMVVNVVLNLILIPDHGALGAAYATLISQSVSALFAPALFKKTRLSFYMMSKSLIFLSSIKYLVTLINQKK